MYAVIKTGGKQYKVSTGDVIYVEKLDVSENSEVNFEVVAGKDDNGFHVGNPVLTTAKVSGKVIKNGKSKKITVFTYKPKKSCKRKMGHRQCYSKVQIENISF
ncbi:MAG: 50S ribosomal protein L21 [Clostridia bacterium]|nr:50S ribosomal protein L21 [Clostridia bacterium]